MSFPFLLPTFPLEARNAQAEMDKKLYEKTLINLSCSRQVSIRLFNQSLYGMKLTFSTHYNASGEALKWTDTALYVSALVAAPTCTFNRRLHASERLKDLLFSRSESKISASRLERVGGFGVDVSMSLELPFLFFSYCDVSAYIPIYFPALSLTREKCVGVLDMILGALICSPRSNRLCSYPGLEPRGLPCWGLPWSQLLGSYIHYCPHFLPVPFTTTFSSPPPPPPSLLSSAMSVSLSHRERAHGCFDVGFDRFVCCCIHLLCIRELTGRKMKICLRFSAWLFGGKCERTPHAFQIHIFLYLKVCACMLCMAINSKDCMVLEIAWFISVKGFFFSPWISKTALILLKRLWWETPPVSRILLLLWRNLVIKKWQLWIESCFSGN